MYTEAFLVCHAPSKPLFRWNARCTHDWNNSYLGEKVDTINRTITFTEPMHTGLLGECQPWGLGPMVQAVYSRVAAGTFLLVRCLLLLFPIWDTTSGCYWPTAKTEQKLNTSCTLAWFYQSHENGGRGEHTLCNENFPSINFNNISFFMIIKRAYQFFQWIFMEF